MLQIRGMNWQVPPNLRMRANGVVNSSHSNACALDELPRCDAQRDTHPTRKANKTSLDGHNFGEPSEPKHQI